MFRFRLIAFIIGLSVLTGCKEKPKGNDRTNNAYYAEYLKIYQNYGKVNADSTHSALSAYLKNFPNNSRAWSFLARVSMDQGQTVQAKAAYLKALTFKPTYAPAYAGLGTLYSWAGSYDSALIMMNTAIEKGDSSEYNYLTLAIVNIKKGDMSAAKTAASHLGPVSNLNPGLLVYAAVVHNELGDDKAAEALAAVEKNQSKDSVLDLYLTKQIKATEYFNIKSRQNDHSK